MFYKLLVRKKNNPFHMLAGTRTWLLDKVRYSFMSPTVGTFPSLQQKKRTATHMKSTANKYM